MAQLHIYGLTELWLLSLVPADSKLFIKVINLNCSIKCIPIAVFCFYNFNTINKCYIDELASQVYAFIYLF